MTAWHSLTPAQADAVRATAASHLRDVEELAAEIRPLVYIDPAEVIGRPDAEAESAVNEPLTATTELPRALPETFSLPFTTSPSPQEYTS